MYPYDYSFPSTLTNTTWTNNNACPYIDLDSSNPNPANLIRGVYCTVDKSINIGMPVSLATDHNGCDPSVCDNCQIAFSSKLDNGATYSTTAKVYPSSDITSTTENSNFEIKSLGNYGGAGRQIQISITPIKSKDIVQMSSACADPKSTGQAETVSISAKATIATLTGNDSIGSVVAIIYDAQGNYYDAAGNSLGTATPTCTSDANCLSGEVCVKNLCSVPLTPDVVGSAGCPSLASCNWRLEWNTNIVKPYLVQLTATDTLCQCVTDTDCGAGEICCEGFCSSTACQPREPSCTDNFKTIPKINPCNF